MKKYPLINRRKPTEKDLDNLGRYRALTESGGSPGSNSGALRSDSGVNQITPELDKQLTPEQLKIRRNELEKERRLQAMQDLLEVRNELRESGYLIFKINR